MAAVQGQLPGSADSAGGESGAPLAFRRAVAGLRGVRPRPEVELDPAPPPRRLAPFSYALEAVVAVDDAELAEGRLILLHDPAGHDAWRGTFRLVTLVHADVEPEIAADPLLPEVCWTWLTGALEARGVSYGEPSGTVTRASSHYFGRIGERRPATRIEIRASWTPAACAPADPAGPGPALPDPAVPDLSVPDPAFRERASTERSLPDSAIPDRSFSDRIRPDASPGPSRPTPDAMRPERGSGPRPGAAPGRRRTPDGGQDGGEGVPDTATHLAAWCDLLCQIAGLPPAGSPEAGVVSLPQRRGPYPR